MSRSPMKVKVDTVRPRALSVEDAAAYMGLARKTVYNRIGPRAKDPLPIRIYRFGGKPLLDLADIDRFLDSLQESAGARR